ncbi:hypothetical protein C2E23DRAFT_324226 [Lenzites betulinus]|nr:hypothetical protein C2E23DRAFT_324226 [Lenzites betulinus]
MILKNVPIRSGIALLQPGRVEFKGHQTADRDVLRDAVLFRALKARLGEDVPLPDPEPQPEHDHPPQDPAQAQRSPLRELSPEAADIELAASGSRSGAGREHDDDMGQPRRRKQPSRVGRSPSPDPPPRQLATQRSRFFSAKPVAAAAGSNGVRPVADEDDDDLEAWLHLDTGDAEAKEKLARAIGLSPPRVPAPATSFDNDSSDDDHKAIVKAAPRRTNERGQNMNGNSANKGKQRASPAFGDPGSEDYEFEFDMDASFLQDVERAEQEALRKTASSNGTAAAHARASSVQAPQTQLRVKPEPRSQSTTRTLFATAATATATLVGSTQRRPAVGTRTGSSHNNSRAGSVPGTSSRSSEVPMEVIDISDDEVEGDKENVPAPTRHVRRRIAPPPPPPPREMSVVDDVIELSD